MISLIARKYGDSSDVMLSIRVKSGSLNTAVALGMSVQPQRFQLIADTIKSARKAYRRGTSIFIDDKLTSDLWLLVKRLMAEDKAKIISRGSIDEAIKDIIHKDEKVALETAMERKRNAVLGIIAPKQQKPSFHEFFDKYVQELQDGTRLKQRSSKKVSRSTIDIFVALHKNLKSFEEQNHVMLDWNDLTIPTFLQFKSFLIQRNLKTNTINQYLEKLNTLLRAARLLHYTAYDDLNMQQCYSANEDTDNIYLTTERINQLYSAKLNDETWIASHLDNTEVLSFIKEENHRQWLCNARDIYVVGCLTGQRYSDYIRINDTMYEAINGHKFIHLYQEKTGVEVYIPLDTRVETVLARNHGSLPSMKRTKLCQMMRIIGQILGWNEPVPITITKGTISYDQKVPFYTLLKSHTCRRSFATNAYRAKVPLSAIMAVTGHASEDMLRKYLKLSNKERALFAAEELAKMQIS